MAKSQELEALIAKLAEYDTQDDVVEADRETRDADRETADAAEEKADASSEAWRLSLVRLHELDDEFDAMSAAHEPPALP